MFYSQFILAKKGPLGTIWIAAHLERKLRKNQVADTDIGVSVDSILSPDVPIALRLSSHLLVGVVRIYSRKVNYLFDDCSEALLKVKQAFRSAAVDLPPEESKAPYHSITLPETFDLDDFELPENEIFQGNFVDHHISSREQITLQDTMEGVSYSSSKFGLDERFGDGDASGLDLDEELFLEKIETAKHSNESADPQAPFGSMTPLEQDDEVPENGNADLGTMVDDDADDPMDYAQAPCTPGLVEEPTLSNVKEVSACDDHLESEYHLVESTMNKTDENEEKISRTLGESALEAKQEHVSGVESPLGQMKTLNSSSEFVDKITEVSGVEDLSGDADKINNSSLTVDKPCHDQEASHEIGLEKGACESSDLTDNFQQVSEGISIKDPEITREQEKSCPDASDLAISDHDDHEKVASTETLFLRPCNSNVEEHDITTSGVQSDVAALGTSEREETVMLGEVCCTTDNSELTKENQIEEHEPKRDTHAALGEPNSQLPTANNSAEAEPAAPEKLLSVPQGHEDLHKNMLIEGSPIGLDEGDAGSKIVSGKKRSFTESTLTEQSLNSVESSRLVRFKRTIDSVPDDDDLLSSILVGRSSILKVKPTPRVSEVTSTKRTRLAPRTGPTKRKVLMDDSMVLHGDTIRQQLTNTEDIRRVRKKAPCTRPEISMIKKQYLEDEIFSEPSCTGMSIELASLQSEVCDLSRITVYKDEANSASLDIVAEPRLPSENDENALETTTEPISSSHDAEKDASLASAAEPHLTSQKAENDKPLDIENDKGPKTRIDTEQIGERISGEVLFDRDINEVVLPSENPVLGDNRTEEIDQTNIEINLSNEQTIPTNGLEADISHQEPLLDVTELETAQRNDDTAIPPDGKTDMPFVEMDTAEMDAGNGRAAISRDELTEKDGDIDAAVETEPVIRDDEVARDDAKQGELEHNVLLGEQGFDSSYPAEIGLNVNSFMNNGEPSEAYEQYMTMDAESSGFNLHDREELKYSAAGDDTEFLNVDDDDMTEMADDHIPDDEEARFAENTGWSSRTRAVSKYLQTLFVKEAEVGRKSLSMDSLLIGKSRKEASRMFFEALVLKTRDYIHVEQRNSFDDITIKPRARLLKSEF